MSKAACTKQLLCQVAAAAEVMADGTDEGVLDNELMDATIKLCGTFLQGSVDIVTQAGQNPPGPPKIVPGQT